MKLKSQHIFNCFIAGTLLTALAGCTATGSYVSFEALDKPLPGKVAEQSFRYDGVERNPVIVIPGFVGSRLVDPATDDVVWGKFLGREGLTAMSAKKSLQLSLPMEEGKKIRDIKDGLVPDGPLDNVKVRILGISGRVPGYDKLVEGLSFIGYYSAEDSYSKYDYGKQYDTLFQFGYDWRCDLPTNAAKLHQFILEKKKYIQEQYEKHYGIKDYDVQFDIVCHSMGGLLSRYYLRYGDKGLPEDGSVPEITWAGSKNVDKVIIVGTPNSGYSDTFMELNNGLRISPGTALVDPAIVGTFATIYEMMPVAGSRRIVYDNTDEGEEVDIFDPDVWIKYQWGLADPKQDKVLKKILPGVEDADRRREIAIDHLRKCLVNAKQFTESMRVPATPPEDVELYLFCGAAIRTSEIVVVDKKTGAIKVGRYGSGDGKVLASSAIFDLRSGGEWQPALITPIEWKAVYLLLSAHMGLTEDPVFIANLFEILTPKEPKAQD